MTTGALSRLVYGGSFDPVHRGHIAMMKYVLSRGLARRLDVVPAKVSPFKQDQPPSLPEELRLELLGIAVTCVGRELGAADLPVRILDFELRSPPPSYTARTLRWLRESYPGERIGLLVGSDSFRAMADWKTPDEILANHAVLVFRRAGDEIAGLEERAGEFRALAAGSEIRFLDNTLVDCSSTQLRGALKTGEKIGDCLPEEILAHLRAAGVYRN